MSEDNVVHSSENLCKPTVSTNIEKESAISSHKEEEFIINTSTCQSNEMQEIPQQKTGETSIILTSKQCLETKTNGELSLGSSVPKSSKNEQTAAGQSDETSGDIIEGKLNGSKVDLTTSPKRSSRKLSGCNQSNIKYFFSGGTAEKKSSSFLSSIDSGSAAVRVCKDSAICVEGSKKRTRREDIGHVSFLLKFLLKF